MKEEAKNEQSHKTTEEAKQMSKIDLSELTDEELKQELARRKEERENANKPKLKNVTMAEAFGLAKKYELDNEFSIKFGAPNIETNWVHFLNETNINMTPFVTWYTDSGKKVKHVPSKDAYGLYTGWANITLVSGDKVIQTSVTPGSMPNVWRALLAHCI